MDVTTKDHLPEDDQTSKNARLVQRIEGYRSILDKWEATILKVQGRKPGKNDLKLAPEHVQRAYEQHQKLRKYLKKPHSGSSVLNSANPKARVGPTPTKIFIRPRSEGGAVGTSSNGNGSSDDDVFKTPPPPKKLVVLTSPRSGNGVKSGEKKGVDAGSKISKLRQPKGPSFQIFKERLSFVETMMVKNPQAKGKEKTGVAAKPSGVDADVDETDRVQISQNDECENSIFHSGKYNSVSMIVNALSSPPSGSGIRSHHVQQHDPKAVDSSWLERCDNMNGQNGSMVETSISITSVSSSEPSVQDSGDKEPCVPLEININDPCLNGNGYAETSLENSFSQMEEGSDLVFDRDEILDIINNEILFAPAPPVVETTSVQYLSSSSQKEQHNSNNAYQIETSKKNETSIPNPVIPSISVPSFSLVRVEDNQENSNSPKPSNKRKASPSPSPSPSKKPKRKFFKSDRAKPKYIPSLNFPPKKNGTVVASKGPKRRRVISSDDDSDFEANVDANTPSCSTMKPNTRSTSPHEHEINSPVKKKPKSKAKPRVRVTLAKDGKRKPKSAKPKVSSKAASTKNGARIKGDATENPYNNDTGYFEEGATDKTKKGRGNKFGISRRGRKAGDNSNFVRIDITKKVFSRGHKKISGIKFRRDKWKDMKAAASKEEKLMNFVCRKCGERGHFQKFCPKQVDDTGASLGPEIDESPFPSLNEAAAASVIPTHRVNIYPKDVSGAESCAVGDPTPPAEKMFVDCRENANVPKVEAYFAAEDGISRDEEDKILHETLQKFGFQDFRPGQKETITRILRGSSTLCVLSTGSGKSLCYQLPAYLYSQKHPGALAICVSPLVSLMDDQVQGLPGFIQAERLHSGMPAGQREKVIERVRAQKLQVLLVSPEAVCGGLFGLLRTNDLPPISFACIDEVHCVSQWSHNFRPCYLQLSKICKERLNISTILGLTATATEFTAQSICKTLWIDPSTTIRGELFPPNLTLSVSRDLNRDQALIALLQGERMREFDSIIVYCTRRNECQRIAILLRTRLQDALGGKHKGITNINSRQRVSCTCEAYHAGMSSAKRRLVQQQFMTGKIRIVVATVAFGMGIDKSDIRSVIHYNMPKSFESYVQEIGRAGRDGLPAHCHLFLDSVKGRDLSELKRHVHCNSIDRTTLRKLLGLIFKKCKCPKPISQSGGDDTESTVVSDNGESTKAARRCPGHEVSFVIDDAVMELDLPQENIQTILCYLELAEERKWIEVLSNTYQTCKIHSYGGPTLLNTASAKCPPLATAISRLKEKKKFKEGEVYVEFDVIEVASVQGWSSGVVKRELKNLEWIATNHDERGIAAKFRKSGVLVEFCDLAFHANAPGDLTSEEADEVLGYLFGRNQEQEKVQLYQLNRIYQALFSVSSGSVDKICDKADEEKSSKLKTFIGEYFAQQTVQVPNDWKAEADKANTDHESDIRRDISKLMNSTKDVNFTARSIARILQGIPSPCFPSEVWGRNRVLWRRYLDCDYHYLTKIAGEEVLRGS